MPEPFKNFFNPTMISQMGHHLARDNPHFDVHGFVETACNGLESLELKQRSNHIRDSLLTTLPADHRTACQMMLGSLHPVEDAELGQETMDNLGIRGWAIMPMADVVAMRGIQDFDFSLDVLAQLTKRFSAEFAIRPFFIHDPQAALKKAKSWSRNGNFHVRRLASEGSRPRLPWGLQIQSFIHDPCPLLPLLEELRNDGHEYVRRSVANNLNDIAKDHPNTVAEVADRWMKGADKETERLVRHACRTLVKKGHGPTLKALGYGPPEIEIKGLQVATPVVRLGKSLNFSLTICSTAQSLQPLIVDFIIHHRMANGRTSPKTFKWKNLDLASGDLVTISKKHPIKPITTRTFYAGRHILEIQINGEIVAKATFELDL